MTGTTEDRYETEDSDNYPLPLTETNTDTNITYQDKVPIVEVD